MEEMICRGYPFCYYYEQLVQHVYSMAFRLLRICSTAKSFEFRLNELKNNSLIPRGYKPKIVDCQFDRVRKLPGNTFEEK